jgi:membrane protein YqaA with SNARE-associated domain
MEGWVRPMNALQKLAVIWAAFFALYCLASVLGSGLGWLIGKCFGPVPARAELPRDFPQKEP